MVIVTPLLVLIIAGVIEFGWVFSIRQDLTTVTRDCARYAMLLTVTQDEIEDRLAHQLSRRGFSNLAAAPVYRSEDAGVVTVEVSVPYREIGLWPWAEILGLDLSVTVRSSTREETG